MKLRKRLARISLVARAFLASAAVLVTVFGLLVVTPVEVDAPIRLGQLAVLFVALLALLVVQLVLVRSALAPLRDLADQMQEIDLRSPKRLTETPRGPALSAFVAAFNSMIERLVEERRGSARAALGAQEAERLRTARELHDEVGQSLTAVALQVEHLAGTTDAKTAGRLDELARQLQGSLGEIRRIVRELRPEALDDLGLINALIALVLRLSRQTGLRIDRELTAHLPALDPDQELVIYRVAQEALTNVVRHAEASAVRVALDHRDGMVELTVEDDGRGMPDGGPAAGTGIEGMRERALLVGASLRIDSADSGGTLVRLALPAEAGG